MPSNILDGKKIAGKIIEDIKKEVQTHVFNNKKKPGLAVILIGEDPASEVYVRNKKIACNKVGFNDVSKILPYNTTQEEVLDLIDSMNNDVNVHGIIVQLPTPKHINPETIIERILPEKDVDGFHPYNMGRLAIGLPKLSSCTPRGIMTLLEQTKVDLRGLNAVVVGASNIVGIPVALELLNKRATVTVCHSATTELKNKVLNADIVVAAVGITEFIKGDWIKPGSIVIDVGINRKDDGSLVGDVGFEEAKKRASWITPVPGGVGPMTIATLLQNTLYSFNHKTL